MALQDGGAKTAEFVNDEGRFLEILKNVAHAKGDRPAAWFEACFFTGICPKGFSMKAGTVNVLQTYSYCSAGFGLTFPYPDRGYGGQTAIWFEVVRILNEAQNADDNRHSTT